MRRVVELAFGALAAVGVGCLWYFVALGSSVDGQVGGIGELWDQQPWVMAGLGGLLAFAVGAAVSAAMREWFAD